MNGDGNEFEGFDLDAERKVLRRAGEIVPLPPKAVELLCVLIKNRGEVVSKNELLDAVWEETFVEESVLSNNIYILRKTLSELGAGKNLIQTVPRRGYRFNAAPNQNDSKLVLEHHVFEQTIIETENELQQIQTEELQPIADRKLLASSARSNFHTKTIAFAAILLALLTGGFAFWQFRATQLVGKSNISEIKSIAVLPLKSFDKISDDETLRLRMTDSLITKLGNLESISVRPTSSVQSFLKQETDALEAGRKLGVDAILEGRVQREGDKVRVTLQLISVRDGEQIWSEQFDGQANQLLNLQDAISSKLLTKINLPLTPEQTATFAKRPTENAEAFEDYLKGRYFRQKRSAESLRAAISFYEKAIAADPNFAEAYVGLADSYYLLVDYSYDTSPENVTRAKENLLKAIAMKPNYAEAYVTLGLIETTYEWEWRRAEQSFLKALELSPNLPDAHHRYAMLLLKLRRFTESETAIRRAKELDPLSLSINKNFGATLFCLKRFDEAIDQFNKTLELDPNFTAPRWYLARCYWAKGEKKKSLAENIRALQASGDGKLAEQIERQMAILEPEKVVENWAQKWSQKISPTGISAYDLAILSSQQNKTDETLQWLEKSVESRHPWATWFNAEPNFDFLRDEPRFQEILRRMNL